MRLGSVRAGALLAAVALHALALAAEPGDPWTHRLAELRCQQIFERDAPSLDPPLIAMIAACRRVKLREPSDGPFSLIAFDAAKDEWRAIRISAFWSGGLHYTRTGEIVWFSEVNQALVGKRQRFVEAFSLAPRSSVERSLGKIELPFVAGGTTLVKGDDCHVLRMQSRLDDSRTPVEHRLLLFDDGHPTESGRMLSGIEEVLFFEPRSKVFVVEVAPAPAASGSARVRALDCSRRVAPLDAAIARRLDELQGRRGTYRAAATGDLLVDVDAAAAGRPLPFADYAAGPRTILFRGDTSTIFPPLIRCEPVVDETWCDSYRALSYGWSPSGRHFALRQPGGVLRVYRTEDLSVVYERQLALNRGLLFIDDASAYVLGRRGRIERQTWD